MLSSNDSAALKESTIAPNKLFNLYKTGKLTKSPKVAYCIRNWYESHDSSCATVAFASYNDCNIALKKNTTHFTYKNILISVPTVRQHTLIINKNSLVAMVTVPRDT